MKKYIFVMILLMPWIVSAGNWFSISTGDRVSSGNLCSSSKPRIGGMHSGVVMISATWQYSPQGSLYCQATPGDEWPKANKSWLESCDKKAKKNDSCTTYQVNPSNGKRTNLTGVCLPAPSDVLLCQSSRKGKSERQRRVEERKRQVEEWRKAKEIN